MLADAVGARYALDERFARATAQSYRNSRLNCARALLPDSGRYAHDDDVDAELLDSGERSLQLAPAAAAAARAIRQQHDLQAVEVLQRLSAP